MRTKIRLIEEKDFPAITELFNYYVEKSGKAKITGAFSRDCCSWNYYYRLSL